MTSPHSLPPDADAWAATHPDLEAPWRLAANADPLAQAPPPDPARIAQIQANLESLSAKPLSLRLVAPLVWIAAAACVAVLLAVGITWYQQPITVATSPGQTASVTLPDGSMVRLSSTSTLQYARRFGTAVRRVILNGEAFFEVIKAETPFIVETNAAEVTVLGTSFNVRAFPDDEEAIVSVAKGVVQVQAKEVPDEAVVLQASEVARVATTQARLAPADPTAPSAVSVQRTGGFYCFDWSYDAIFAELERRYDVAIHASEALRSRRRTFTKQHAATIEQVLSDFTQSAGLRYRPVSDGYEVYEP